MDIVEFPKSQRNKQIAFRLDYIFNLHRPSNVKQDLQCKEYFRKTCLATIQTKCGILFKSKYIHKPFLRCKMPARHHLKRTLYNKKRANLPPLTDNLGSLFFPDSFGPNHETKRYKKANTIISEKFCQMHKF